MKSAKDRKTTALVLGFVTGAVMQAPLLISLKLWWVLGMQLGLSMIGIALMIVTHRRLNERTEE